ncbi:MAG TPA: tetratricopeptide repeat protein [Burkholderiales bacterium]|nr:tetratricopeptide repeat protein [Burkholderiales bacterium]
MLWRQLRRLLRRGPAAALAERSRGDALFDAGDYQGAVVVYERVARSQPTPGTWVNVGYARLFLGRAAAARAAFEEALALQPEFAPALTGLGDLCANGGDHPAAAGFYRRALDAEPDLAVSHNNLSLSLTALGELEPAWREAEWRYELPQVRNYYPRGKLTPRWDGTPLGGRRLLVHWEQGYGDVIQHLRFLGPLAARAPGFVFECPPPLLRLASASFGAAQVVESREGLPPFDVCAPLLSLPLLLGSKRDALPAPPYLSADSVAAARFRGQWSAGGRKLLGVAWRSSSFDPARDADLGELLALATPRTQLISLQKDPTAQERELLRARGALDAGSGFTDFFDTAAAIAALDAVLSVDTSVAHLAGALDLPTWLLLTEPAAVRWMSVRADSPWYPSMRLVRRAPGRAWPDVISAAGAAIDAQLG